MRLLARIHFILPISLLSSVVLCSGDDIAPAVSSPTAEIVPQTTSNIPLTTEIAELEVSTTDNSNPFFTFPTTPMITLNGEEFPPKVVPLTGKESRHFQYLTESPPTTLETEVTSSVPQIVTAKVKLEETASTVTVKPEVEAISKSTISMSQNIATKLPTSPVPEIADVQQMTTTAGGLTAITTSELAVTAGVNVEVATAAKLNPEVEITEPEISLIGTSSAPEITELTRTIEVNNLSTQITTPPSMSESLTTASEDKLATIKDSLAVKSSEMVPILMTSQVEVTTLESQSLLSSTAAPVTEKANSVEFAGIPTTKTLTTTRASGISIQTASVGSIAMTPETAGPSSITQETKTTAKAVEITSKEVTTIPIATEMSIVTESSQEMPLITSPVPGISPSSESIVSMRVTPVVTIPEVQITTIAESKESETSMLQNTEGISLISTLTSISEVMDTDSSMVPSSTAIPTESPGQTTNDVKTEQMLTEDEVTGVPKVPTQNAIVSGDVVTSSAQSTESIQPTTVTSPTTTKPLEIEITAAETTQPTEMPTTITPLTTSAAEQLQRTCSTTTTATSTEKLVETIIPTETATAILKMSSKSTPIATETTPSVSTKATVLFFPSTTVPDDITTETHSSTTSTVNNIAAPLPPMAPAHITSVKEAKTTPQLAVTEDWRRQTPVPSNSETSEAPTTEMTITAKPETMAADILITSEPPKIEEILTAPTSNASIMTSPLPETTKPTQTTQIQPAVTEKPSETVKAAVDPNSQRSKDADSEGMTLATAISMGLILIFLLILLCILAVSLIAGWVHCRGRDSRRPKVSLIRVERGLATELADSWSKGRSAQAWMTTQSGAAAMTTHSSSSSPQQKSQPQHLPPSFQCGCKQRGLFRRANRLCMVHGDPSTRHGASAVRAVRIISLSDESDVEESDAVLLTELDRRRASGASNTPEEEERERDMESDGGKRRSEWLFIDEA